MKLYFAPLACSFGARILAHEWNLDLEFVQVDKWKKTLADGSSYLDVHPLGLVPALQREDGTLISENAAVLWYLAEHSGNLPSSAEEQHQLRQWLSFIGAELHKTVFGPFFDPESSDAVRAYATKKSIRRFAVLESRLEPLEGPHLVGDAFSIADAYLLTVLNWTQATPLKLLPRAKSYLKHHVQRPTIQKARDTELPLYQEELAKLSA